MKKILVILNGIQYPHQVMKYAIKLAKENGGLIQAVFLQLVHYKTEYSYPFPNDMQATGVEVAEEELEKERNNIVKEHIGVFINACKNTGVPCQTQLLKEENWEELITLTAFSDLVVIHEKANLTPSAFKELLSDAHCPVYLVSKDVETVEKIILTYDGSFSSIYAIKMFSYLFKPYRNLTAHLIYISNENKDELAHHSYIQSWLSLHFSDLHVHVLQGSVRKELVNFIQLQANNAVVVMGAYGRNALSRLFKQSLADIVLKQTGSTIFMAHEKH